MFNLLSYFPLLQLGLCFHTHPLLPMAGKTLQVFGVSETNKPGMGDFQFVPDTSNHSSLARSEVI